MIRTLGLVVVRAATPAEREHGAWTTVSRPGWACEVTPPEHAERTRAKSGERVTAWCGDDELTDLECPCCASSEPCHQRVEVTFPLAPNKALPRLLVIHQYEPGEDFLRCRPS